MSDRMHRARLSASTAGAIGTPLLNPDECESVLLLDREATELALLLPTTQAVGLERVAQQHGLTVGQLLRRIIREYLANHVS